MTTNLEVKYAPQTLNDVVFSDVNTEVFLKAIESKEMHSNGLLLYGTNGTGKTLCANLIAKALTNNGGLLLSMTIEDFLAIGDLRQYLSNTQMLYAEDPLDRCVIVFDELDEYGKSLAPLWVAMDKFADRLLVIITTNHPSIFPRAVLSRCDKYEFTRITPAMYTSRAQRILAAEGLVLSCDDVEYYLTQYTAANSDVREYTRIMEKMLLLNARGLLPSVPRRTGAIRTPRLTVLP